MLRKKKTISFDFDGVIHVGYDGYRDGSIYGSINYSLLHYMGWLLRHGYYVVISSARPAQQIIDFLSSDEVNRELKLRYELFERDEEHVFWNKSNIIGVTNYKVPAAIYIDDRAFEWHNPLSIVRLQRTINNELK